MQNGLIYLSERYLTLLSCHELIVELSPLNDVRTRPSVLIRKDVVTLRCFGNQNQCNQFQRCVYYLVAALQRPSHQGLLLVGTFHHRIGISWKKLISGKMRSNMRPPSGTRDEETNDNSWVHGGGVVRQRVQSASRRVDACDEPRMRKRSESNSDRGLSIPLPK